MEASMDLFINLIQNHRIIYDKSLKDFKNTKKKEESWQDIAKQSRMTVDAVKKRYASIRQKYCREKRNIEVNRRNKRSTQCNWAYFDRLNFLDSFIQPRPTYTNDTLFEEDVDQTMGDIENSSDIPRNVEVELEEGIDINELDILNGDDQNAEGMQIEDLLVAESNQDSQGNDDEHSNLHVGERITSDYTAEESLTFYLSPPNTNVPDEEINSNVTNNGSEVPSSKEQSHSAQSIDMDNYVSRFPGTSRGIATKSSAVRGSKVSKNNNPSYKPSSRQQTHPQQQPSVRQHSSGIVSSKDQTVSTSELASMSSKDKRIEAIRQKMDSCLTAINKKVNDTPNRSPHAPFLAYLGTKLPNVAKEKLPQLERELLELVDFHST